MAGVLTPPAAIASSTAPASVCSGNPARNSAHPGGESAFGDANGLAHHRDLVSRFDATCRAHGQLAIDEFGLGERVGQQRGESGCDRVGSDAERRLGPVDLLQDVDQRHRIPGQSVEVIVADLLGDTLVIGAVEVDIAGGAHHDTHRAERSRPGYPQLRGAGDIANVGLPPEHQDVEVVCLHLGQRPFPTPDPQLQGVRRNLSHRRGSRGSR